LEKYLFALDVSVFLLNLVDCEGELDFILTKSPQETSYQDSHDSLSELIWSLGSKSGKNFEYLLLEKQAMREYILEVIKIEIIIISPRIE